MYKGKTTQLTHIYPRTKGKLLSLHISIHVQSENYAAYTYLDPRTKGNYSAHTYLDPCTKGRLLSLHISISMYKGKTTQLTHIYPRTK